MERNKIDYGIDLGTTNSAICRMEKGVPVIQKTDIQADIMPSCVAITKKGALRIGQTAYNIMQQDKRRASKSWKKEASNTYVEFKRAMGTDRTYESSFLGKNLSAEELSAEVLKTLKSFVLDESVNIAVITVPAKFTLLQKTATLEAAKLAGFEHCELLQEPIAASMAYGLSTEEKNGYWMVFDFGGGTFDAALLKVEDGIMQVFDTEGDNYLGGKNLDLALVNDIIIPYLKENFAIDGILAVPEKKEILQETMKTYTEEAKNQLSFQSSWDILSNLDDLGEDDNGEEIELDLTITQEQAFASMRPYFQKAVDICKKLLQRNNMTGEQLNKLILVGGPTHSPLVRNMLREQITTSVDTSIDPMTAVATGAALYASTIDSQITNTSVPTGTIQLTLRYESTSVENSEWISIQLNNSVSSNLDGVLVELVKSDGSWSSGKFEVSKTGNVTEVMLQQGRINSFKVNAYDQQGNLLPCFPNEISIIQGTKVGAAVLPYYIGIGTLSEDEQVATFTPMPGLEKNKPIPATGQSNGISLKTTCQLRPGISEDKLVIPVYQADEYEEDTPAYLYERIGAVNIDGRDVEKYVPEDTPVEITIRVIESERQRFEVYIPIIDQTIEKEFDVAPNVKIAAIPQEIEQNFSDAQETLNNLVNQGIDTTDLQQQLEGVKKEDEENSEKKMVLQHQKEVLREIAKRKANSEFGKTESELKRVFKMVEEDNQKYGTPDTTQRLEELRIQVDAAIVKLQQKATDSVKHAKQLIKDIRDLDYDLALVDYFKAWVYNWNLDFETTAWKDKNRARQLLNQAIGIINGTPTKEALYPVVRQLVNLLPETSVPANANNFGLLRRK